MLNFSVKILILFLICCLVVVLGFYAFNFYGNGLSDSPEQWGQLGDYFGGILNPIFGFTTILILIATIGIQREQLEASREELALTRKELERAAEAAARQAGHFEREAKLSECLVLIDKLVGRINKNFNENRLDNERSLHGFVSSCLDTRESSYVDDVLAFWNPSKSSATKRVVGWVESDLKRLAVLIEAYERVSSDGASNGEGGSPMPSFYQEEFGDMVAVLFSYGMVSSDVKAFFAPNKSH